MASPIQTRQTILNKINSDINQLINEKNNKREIPKALLDNLMNELRQGTEELSQKKLQPTSREIQDIHASIKNAQNALKGTQEASKLMAALNGFSNALRQNESPTGKKPEPAIKRGTMGDKNF